jgi:hypothetical protein
MASGVLKLSAQEYRHILPNLRHTPFKGCRQELSVVLYYVIILFTTGSYMERHGRRGALDHLRPYHPGPGQIHFRLA